MTSNISIEITALIFTICVLYHFLIDKKLNDFSNRVFTFFVTVGIIDIALDVISTILLEKYAGMYISLTKLSLTLLYLVQAVLPWAFVMYTQSLRRIGDGIRSGVTKVLTLISGLLMVMIVVNYVVGYFFYYDANGVYHHGSLYFVMYAYAGIYFLIVGVISIIHRKELVFREFVSLWEYLLINAACVMVQFITGSLLTIGLGIGLGITMLYVTVSNPNTHVDSFTGLPDRKYFARWINEKRAKGDNINIVAVDLFKIKWLNKAYGGTVADSLLLDIIRRISGIVEEANVFRISGREIFVELDNAQDFQKVKRTLQGVFEEPIKIEGELTPLPAIIVAVPNAERFDNPDKLIQYIEYIISLAPEGEDTILLQDEVRIMEGFRQEEEIENYLDIAIEEDLFQLYYQPVFSVKEDGYVSLEALSRLIHPSLGHIPPDVFIGIAEKNRTIDKIGLLQMRRVCRFIKEHEEIMDKIGNIKVNLSPQELLKEGHARALVDMIHEYNLEPSYFNFEITETLATEYGEMLDKAIREFVDAGVRLCLDDFGSGYANLNTVLKLPFETIKLDRSLLNGLLEDRSVAAFYESIVRVLSDMGYNLVAEGVETQEEVELLAKWNVDMIQGYYFSRPLPTEEILELVTRK